MNAILAEVTDHHQWTPEEIIDVANRQLMIGLISGDLTEAKARYLGRTIGHWALIEQADRDVKSQGWFVVRQLTGMEE